MIILVGGEKGGTGKSCLSQNLSVYLQLINRDVVLIDADAQQTSTNCNRDIRSRYASEFDQRWAGYIYVGNGVKLPSTF